MHAAACFMLRTELGIGGRELNKTKRSLLWYGHQWHGESESERLVTQLCQTLCDPMDYTPPGSSVHGILQARMLEWLAVPFSKRTSTPRD